MRLFRSSDAASLLLPSLLLLLCCAAQPGAGSPESVSGAPGGPLDQLSGYISGAVKTASQLATAGLDGPLAEVEARLVAELGGLFSRLERVIREQETELKATVSAVTEQALLQLADVKTELATQNSELTTQLERIGSDLSTVQAQLKQSPAATAVRDCSDLPAGAPSGVHLVRPALGRPVPAFCDQETAGGGWTVVQRRADIRPRQDFFLGWEGYKWGFGRLEAEFWWGLEHLWLTTSLLDRRYELRIDMEDFEGEKRHALYQDFKIASEADGYRLTVVNYTGDAGDSLQGHIGHRFSTKDRDQDAASGSSCAKSYSGAWWYENCHSSNLNGLYLAGNHSSYANGVNWRQWKGYHYSLKTVTMKIRPTTA